MEAIITEFVNFMGKHGQYYHEFYVDRFVVLYYNKSKSFLTCFCLLVRAFSSARTYSLSLVTRLVARSIPRRSNLKNFLSFFCVSSPNPSAARRKKLEGNFCLLVTTTLQKTSFKSPSTWELFISLFYGLMAPEALHAFECSGYTNLRSQTRQHLA